MPRQRKSQPDPAQVPSSGHVREAVGVWQKAHVLEHERVIDMTGRWKLCFGLVFVLPALCGLVYGGYVAKGIIERENNHRKVGEIVCNREKIPYAEKYCVGSECLSGAFVKQANAMRDYEIRKLCGLGDPRVYRSVYQYFDDQFEALAGRPEEASAQVTLSDGQGGPDETLPPE
ncbi:hypothetical protein [Henriciella pelagia]|uniref:hypothetical protein n=1 Tax=Henriciella pelagia TaxID=1977912 RepID=UPI0035124673